MRMGKKKNLGVPFGYLTPRAKIRARDWGDARFPPRAHDLHVVATVSAALAPILVHSGEIIMTHAQVQTIVDCMTSSVNI